MPVCFFINFLNAIAVIIVALINGAFVLFKRNTNEKIQISNSNQTIVKRDLINNFVIPQTLVDQWKQILNEQDPTEKAFMVERENINIITINQKEMRRQERLIHSPLLF